MSSQPPSFQRRAYGQSKTTGRRSPQHRQGGGRGQTQTHDQQTPKVDAYGLGEAGGKGGQAKKVADLQRRTGAGRIRVGISGWRYPPWRGVFYPATLPQRQELAYASRHFSAIEINGSFYSLQHPDSYASWYADTPSTFVFAVKGSRFITHMRKLREVQEPLANFFASGLFNLREKLGPILWQLPPTFKYDRSRLEPFLARLPQDTRSACHLALRRSRWMKGRTRLGIDANRPLRHAIEVRHESFLDSSFVALLRAHRVALVIAETAGLWPLVHDITSDFVYLRLHGDKDLYRSGYSSAALDRWARRIRDWSVGREPADASRISKYSASPAVPRDVYCFFDNTDVKLRAPRDAKTLMRKLEQGKANLP